MERDGPEDSGALVTAQYTMVDLAGDSDAAEWRQAQPIAIEQYWSGEPAPASRQAVARFLWSENALHVRFECQQAERLVVSANPQTEKKTLGLWDRDVCEIFVAPDPNIVERYYEFEAAPTGEWLDVGIHWSPEQRESDWEFSSGMNAAVRIEKDRVTIAMRIPWSEEIPKPQAGEHWRVNLFRCVGSDPDRGYLAWQPTRTPDPNFHVPRVFGSLIFK